jgi:drug/metabolite transporter (DMT)-like permease
LYRSVSAQDRPDPIREELRIVNRSSADVGTIPLTGVLLLIMVSIIWGGNMVSIKISNQGIPPILAAAARSLLASVALWAYARAKGEDVFLRGPDVKHGIVIGILFGLDFLFLYWGPAYTTASRAIIFLYTHPLWVAIGAHILIPGDSLTKTKGLGLGLAFVGLVLVFGAKSDTLGPQHWIGDLMEVLAAMFWAATTVYLKKFIWRRPISHFQTLFAQLAFSIPVLAVAAFLFERGLPISPTPLVIAAFGYQVFIVATFSYLLWFWMIHRYPVSRLAAFTFLAPLFGVIASGVILGETLTVSLWIGLALVAAGIYLVNRPEPKTQAG